MAKKDDKFAKKSGDEDTNEGGSDLPPAASPITPNSQRHAAIDKAKEAKRKR